jgi:hypothetical protein
VRRAGLQQQEGKRNRQCPFHVDGEDLSMLWCEWVAARGERVGANSGAKRYRGDEGKEQKLRKCKLLVAGITLAF